MKRVRNTVWQPPVAALVAVGVLAVAAVAQNNSLLSGDSQRRAARPAGGSASDAPPATVRRGERVVPLVVTQEVVHARQESAYVGEHVRNPVLLAVSPIAVPAPEPRKIKKHDLITIIVREIKSSSSEASTSSEKGWSLAGELKKFLRLNGDHQLIPQNFEEGTPGVDFNIDHKYEGDGESEREDSFTTRITATVIDVKPNATLVLEAKKRIKVDENEQIITLTGKCRTEDITPQNTVLSTQLAELELRAEHTGEVRDASRRGWLMRLFDLLRPI